MLRTLRRLLSAVETEPAPHSARIRSDLEQRVEALESAEVLRAAEHAAMVDRLERLYKRMVTRVSREATVSAEPEESVLTLRDRIRRSRGT